MSKLRLAGVLAGVLALELLAGVVAPEAAHAQAAIVNALQRINDKLDAQVVPFKLTIAGGLCDGAGVPHQIVAESAGADDVVVELFCSTTDEDVSFDTILVAGWKRPADTITVTFTPGS